MPYSPKTKTKKSVQTKPKRSKPHPIKFAGYKTYNFKDHDPILDKLATVMEEGSLSWQEVHERSGVHPTTILAYVHRLVKRPRHATIAAVFAAYGYELMPIKSNLPQKIIPLRR